MAVWQYNFFVVPKETFSSDKEYNVDELFDDELFWSLHPIKTVFFREIESILPEGESWSKELIVYGNIDSNCFEIYHKTGQVTSVSFRIDFSSEYDNILRNILEFCLMNGLVLIDENFNELSYNNLELISVIEHSPQFSTYNKLIEKSKTNNN